MRIDCLIFDLDGVLWDTCHIHSNAFKDTLNNFKVNISFDYKNIAGMSTRRAFEKLLSEKKDLAKIDEMIKFKQLLANQKILLKPPIFDGIDRTIKDLLSLKIKFGIASSTSKKNLQIFIDYLLSKSIFPDFTLSGEDVNNAKPSPEIYLKSIELINSSPEKCLVIEDSINGLIAADKAGCYSIQIGNSDKKLINSQKLLGVIQSVNQLPPLIKKLIS